MKFTTEVHVEWGDCDEAGIVFYPRFFYWFDCAFQRMLRAAGCGQREIRKRYGGAVTPAVSVETQFRAPATHGDTLTIDSVVTKWGRTSFTVLHTFTRDGELILEGTEVRVWGAPNGKELSFTPTPIPEEFRALYGA